MKTAMAVFANGLVNGAIYGLMAVGLTLVFKKSGVLNFAHAATGTLATFVFYVLWVQQAWPYLAAAVVGVAFAAVLGAATFLVLAPRRNDPLMMLIGTLGVAGVMVFVVERIWGSDPYFMPIPLSNIRVNIAGVVLSGARLIVLFSAALLAIIAFLIFRYTRLGLLFRASAAHPYAAEPARHQCLALGRGHVGSCGRSRRAGGDTHRSVGGLLLFVLCNGGGTRVCCGTARRNEKRGWEPRCWTRPRCRGGNAYLEGSIARIARCVTSGDHRRCGGASADPVRSEDSMSASALNSAVQEAPGLLTGLGKILEVDDVKVSFGLVQALAGVSISVRERQIVGLIGPNGAGKTTLFNVISGFVRPTSGHLRLSGQMITGWSATRRARAGLSRTFQNVGLDKPATVVENLCAAQEVSTLGKELVDCVLPKRSGNERRNRREREDVIESVGPWRSAGYTCEGPANGTGQAGRIGMRAFASTSVAASGRAFFWAQFRGDSSAWTSFD